MILNKIMNADSSHLILIKKVQFSSLNKKKIAMGFSAGIKAARKGATV